MAALAFVLAAATLSAAPPAPAAAAAPLTVAVSYFDNNTGRRSTTRWPRASPTC